MQKKVLNPQVFLELVCYVVFAGLLFYLVYTGQYRSYVTPKMVPYFYFTMAVMGVWTLGAISRLFRPQHKTRAAHCFVLAIPIILLLLPHTTINTSELSTGYLSASSYTSHSEQSSSGILAVDQSVSDTGNTPSSDAAIQDNSADDTSDKSYPNTQTNAQNNAQTVIKQDESAGNLPGFDEKNKKITVADDNFAACLYELYGNMDKYVGYTISIKGFVYRDPEIMKANEFVPARLMMSCCVADLSPCGLLCQYDKPAELKDGTWVTVEGTLNKAKTMFNDQESDDIQIYVTKITPAEKVEGYIYP